MALIYYGFDLTPKSLAHHGWKCRFELKRKRNFLGSPDLFGVVFVETTNVLWCTCLVCSSLSNQSNKFEKLHFSNQSTLTEFFQTFLSIVWREIHKCEHNWQKKAIDWTMNTTNSSNLLEKGTKNCFCVKFYLYSSKFDSQRNNFSFIPCNLVTTSFGCVNLSRWCRTSQYFPSHEHKTNRAFSLFSLFWYKANNRPSPSCRLMVRENSYFPNVNIAKYFIAVIHFSH